MIRNSLCILVMVCCLVTAGSVSAGKYLRLENREHVEIQKTRGFLNFNGTFTLETWLRWADKHAGVISLVSDDLSPGELPSKTVREICGWIMRVSPIQDARFRDFELTFAATGPRQKSPTWHSLKTRIAALPEGTESGWHHIAICKTPQTMIVYFDGKAAISAPCTGTRFFAAPTNLYLGVRDGARATRNVFADYRAFRIVDRIVYRRPFKPQLELPKHGRTVLNLDFQQGAAGVIPDSVSGEHSGLVNGGTWLED